MYELDCVRIPSLPQLQLIKSNGFQDYGDLTIGAFRPRRNLNSVEDYNYSSSSVVASVVCRVSVSNLKDGIFVHDGI